MSILYGNDKALGSVQSSYSRHSLGEKYVLVVWQYTESLHWYGSNINEKINSIEWLETIVDKDDQLVFNYRKEGKNQALNDDVSKEDKQKRIDYLLGYKPLILPPRIIQ